MPAPQSPFTPPRPEPDWIPAPARLAIPATLRAGLDRSFHTKVKNLTTSSFTAEAVNRMHPGTRCWLTLPGLAAKQAEVVDWHHSLVTCRFAENLSPLILTSVVERTRPPADH